MSLYRLIDPRDGRTRYVGQSEWPAARLRQHLSPSAQIHVAGWVDELRMAGLKPQMDILPDSGETEAEAIARLQPDLNRSPATIGRETQMQFRVSKSEKAAIEREAARVGLPPATWIRTTLLGAVAEEDRKAAEIALRRPREASRG